MANIDLKEDRQLIPRWRDFRTALKLSELSSSGKANDNFIRNRESQFSKKVGEWKNDKNIFNASEVVSSALVLGYSSDDCNEVKDAANYILNNENKVSESNINIANQILDKQIIIPGEDTNFDVYSPESQNTKIHSLRKSLRENPRDPISWMDLALAYTISGQVDDAERCIKAAYQLGKENRFIIRSTARYFIHRDNVTEAHNILKKCTLSKIDPWVMSAEISVAEAAERKSRLIDKAIKFINDASVNPSDISELAAEIGTIELSHGSKRKAKKYFDKSIILPAENSLAQMSWLVNNNKLNNYDYSVLDNPYANEAKTWDAYGNSDWHSCIKYCWKWLKDQPFSSRPATGGSYVTNLIGRYAESKRFCEIGLYCNPKNATLLNNYVYACIKLNDFDSALKTINAIDPKNWKYEEKFVWIATMGLLNYRLRKPDDGRELYENVINTTTKMKLNRVARIAMINYANEEISYDLEKAKVLCKKAIQLNKGIKDPSEREMLSQLQITAKSNNINTES